MTYNLNDKSLMFKYIAINLKNSYMSTFSVIDTYNLSFAKCIYNFLRTAFPKTLDEAEDISKVYLNMAKIYQKETTVTEDETENKNALDDKVIVYNKDILVTPQSLADINEYSISSWPINDAIIQYLHPDTVINESTTIDKIAEVQLLCGNINYTPVRLGTIDDEFTKLCCETQKLIKDTNSNVIATGYFDIYVEYYMRSLGEVRSN